jgi:hypothetical protein
MSSKGYHICATTFPIIAGQTACRLLFTCSAFVVFHFPSTTQLASFYLFIHNILVQSRTFAIALLALSDYNTYWNIPSVFNFKYCGLLASVAFHHYTFNQGFAPQPRPLKMAGVAVKTLRIFAPQVVQAGGSWSNVKSNSTITSSPGHS